MENILNQQLFTFSHATTTGASTLNQRHQVSSQTALARVAVTPASSVPSAHISGVASTTMSMTSQPKIALAKATAPDAPSPLTKYRALTAQRVQPKMLASQARQTTASSSSSNLSKLDMSNLQSYEKRQEAGMGPLFVDISSREGEMGIPFKVQNYAATSIQKEDFMDKQFRALRKVPPRGTVVMSAAASEQSSQVYKVVFVRHGESTWNQENRFTGWTDVPLSKLGEKEALEAGKLIKDSGIKIDCAYTSMLQRAINTYKGIGETVNLKDIPLKFTYRLNERHYGSLQGLNKAETAKIHGEDQVKIWRRSFDVPPPTLEVSDERHPRHDRLYKNLPDDMLPAAESLKTTIDRVMPFWFEWIVPQIMHGKTPIVVAHGNSLRAIVKALNNMSEEEILEYNIPTAVPLVFEFDNDMKVLKNYYLLDEEAVKAKQAAVANQGKAK